MECQPGGHVGHLGHSMMLDPNDGSMHQQDQDHRKKRKYKHLIYVIHSFNQNEMTPSTSVHQTLTFKCLHPI